MRNRTLLSSLALGVLILTFVSCSKSSSGSGSHSNSGSNSGNNSGSGPTPVFKFTAVGEDSSYTWSNSQIQIVGDTTSLPNYSYTLKALEYPGAQKGFQIFFTRLRGYLLGPSNSMLQWYNDTGAPTSGVVSYDYRTPTRDYGYYIGDTAMLYIDSVHNNNLADGRFLGQVGESPNFMTIRLGEFHNVPIVY